jgi:hypothetical protein
VPDIIRFLLNHKEVFGVAASAVGVVKTAYDILQSRSRASTRDKLLLRIQGLEAARQAMSREDAAASQHSVDTAEAVRSQLSEALAQLAKISQGAGEKSVAEGGLRLIQRVFLLYRPATTRAWLPHSICWLLSLLFPFYLLGISLSNGVNGNPSWATLAQNLKNPDTYYGLLFFLGIFLLARSWGVWERNTYQQKQIPIAVQAEALPQLAKVPMEAKEGPIAERGLGLFQRVFLLYKPATMRAWIPHTICWLLALLISGYLLSSWLPDEDNGNSSWANFVQNWKNPDTYYVLVFLLGIFLLARSWGVWERKTYQRKKGPTSIPSDGFRLTTVAAVLYGLVGVGFLFGEVAFAVGPGFGVFGAVIAASGLTLYVWGKLADRKVPLTIRKAIFLLLPAVLLALVSIFDIDGIIVQDFRHNILGYWRSWIDEPAVPVFLLPFATLPLYAGVRCIRSALKQQGQN